jgi:hypothetical protein
MPERAKGAVMIKKFLLLAGFVILVAVISEYWRKHGGHND